MVRYSDVMLAVLLRCEAHMLASLAGKAVTQLSQSTTELSA